MSEEQTLQQTAPTETAPVLLEARAEKNILKFPDKLSDDQEMKRTAIEAMYQSFEILSELTASVKGIDTTNEASRKTICDNANLMSDAETASREIWNSGRQLSLPGTPDDMKDEYRQKYADSQSKLAAYYEQTFGKPDADDQRPKRELTLSEEQIETAYILLYTAHHDTVNVTGTLAGFVDLAARTELPDDFRQEMFDENVMPQIDKLIQRVADMRTLVESGFEVGDVSVESIMKDMQDNMDGYLKDKQIPISHSRLSTEQQAQKVRYSKLMSKLLSENTAANARKAAAISTRPYEVAYSAATVEDGGKKFLQITVVDTGPGYPQDIVDNGFSSGKTNWQETEAEAKKGTGFAMANNVRTLQDVYGGQLIPSNRHDKDGNITGAQTTIKIPLVQ